MLIYNGLKNKPREFLAATGLKLDKFEQLLPAFQMAYAKKYPPHLTQDGKIRQRQIGGGATRALPKIEDKLFCILVYQKTNPLQTMSLNFSLRHEVARVIVWRVVWTRMLIEGGRPFLSFGSGFPTSSSPHRTSTFQCIRRSNSGYFRIFAYLIALRSR